MPHFLRISNGWPQAWAVLLLCLSLGQLQAQTVTIGSTTVPVVTPATSSYLYGPIYRSAATSTFNYSRYAHLYRATELNIPAGAVITQLAWLKSTAGELTGNNTFNVLMNNTALATLPSPQTWGTLSAGATPVYTSTTQQFTGAAGTYFVVNLSQPFVYTGGNLLILTDHEKRGTATAAVNFVTNLATGQALGFASGTVLTAATNLTSGSYGNRRPTLRISYAPGGPCVSPPTAGAAVAEPDTLCAGEGTSVFLRGASYGQGQTYQYQESTDGTNFSDIIGATAPTFNTGPLSAPRFYRVVVTCGTQRATSTAVRVFVNAPVYAALPLVESFENTWQSICGVRDAPSASWRSNPVVGNNAWRRYDDPAGANWTSPTFGGYTPQASQGSFSARFHSYIATAGLTGTLDLFVNLSAAGPKELLFDHINTNGTDSLFVLLSTDGGATFGRPLLRLGSAATPTFRTESLPLTSTSSTAVLRFLARSDNGTTDIGLDHVRVTATTSCLAPGGLQTGTITSTTASISWSGAGGPYRIEYGPEGFTPGTGTIVPSVPASPYTLTGLSSFTMYDVYVTQLCAGGQTATAGPLTFTTRIGNDECAAAQVLTPGATCNAVPGSVFQASTSAGAPVCAPTVGTPDDDVWYSFVATATAHDIRLAESVGFDGSLQLLTGTCGSLVSRQCVDATAANGVEVIQATGLTVGQRYYLRVYSFSATAPTAANSSFSICVSAPATVPTNDNCAGAISLTSRATCSPTLGTTFRATATAGVPVCTPALGTPDDDVWYSFVASASSHDVRVDELAGFDAVVQVLSGSCGALSSVQCADRTAAGGVESFRVGGLTVGSTYFVRVYSFANTAPTLSNSNFSICITTSPTPPANDDCAGATTLPVQLSTSGCVTPLTATTAGASASAAPAPTACTTPTSGTANYQGGDVWFQVTVTPAGVLALETGPVAGSPILDTGMAVYSGSCGTLTQIACDDNDSPTGSFSLINLTGLTPGDVLYVRVWEAGNDLEGTFTLCATAPSTCIVPAAPGADNIAANSVDLVWGGAAGPGESFSVEYGLQGFSPGTGTLLMGLTGNDVTVTGLLPDTDYCFYVTKQCGGTQGASPTAGPICFRTLPAVPASDEPCGAVTLTVGSSSTPSFTNSTTMGATTSVDNDIQLPACSPAQAPRDVWFAFTATAPTVYLGVTGNPAGMVRVFEGADCQATFTLLACQGVGNNQSAGQLTATGLTVGQRYFVAVSGYGSGDLLGAFRIAASTTLLGARSSLPGVALNVYPNPSNSGQLTVQLSGVGAAPAAQATLLNVLGQPVLSRTLTVQGGAAEQVLNVKGLAAGLYTLQLRVGTALLSRKVVLQ